MVASLWKTRKRILVHPHKKGVRRLSTTEQINTTKEEASQAEDEVKVETHSSLRTACTTATIAITAEKIAQHSSNPKERWSKIANSICHNPYLEK
jgi:hypothetical protein